MRSTPAVIVGTLLCALGCTSAATRAAPEAGSTVQERGLETAVVDSGLRVPRVVDAWVIAQQKAWDALPNIMPDSAAEDALWRNTTARMTAAERCGSNSTKISPDFIWVVFDDSTTDERRLFIADSIHGRIVARSRRPRSYHLIWIRPNCGCDMLSLTYRLLRVPGVASAIADAWMPISGSPDTGKKLPFSTSPPPSARRR